MNNDQTLGESIFQKVLSSLGISLTQELTDTLTTEFTKRQLGFVGLENETLRLIGECIQHALNTKVTEDKVQDISGVITTEFNASKI